MTLNMLASISPRMAGGDEWAGNHAKNLETERHGMSWYGVWYGVV